MIGDKRTFDALGGHFRLAIVATDLKAVHLRPQADELTRSLTATLILHLTDDLGVCVRV